MITFQFSSKIAVMMRTRGEKNGNNAEDLNAFQSVPITNLFFVFVDDKGKIDAKMKRISINIDLEPGDQLIITHNIVFSKEI